MCSRPDNILFKQNFPICKTLKIVSLHSDALNVISGDIICATVGYNYTVNRK